jgi:TolB protein
MPREQAWRGKKLMWFTFSSRRAYGLRQEAGKNAQIWMAAFDPSATAESKDGSFAAFRLPFQELGSGNHTAQWVTKVVRKGCTDAAACEGGEICQDGACRPLVK